MDPKELVSGKAERIWVKSKWKSEELDGKSVEFTCISRDYGQIKGNGVFMAAERAGGEIAVIISVDQQGRTPSERIDTRFYLDKKAVEAIKKNPAGSKFEFSCFTLK